MNVYRDPAPVCGHESCGSLLIDYSIPGGVQKCYHPNPSMAYQGVTLRAYLPDNADGQQLLKRLIYAWKQGLTFNIGANNAVTLVIHHMIRRYGGPRCNGFPDLDYFKNRHRELDKLGIPAHDQI